MRSPFSKSAVFLLVAGAVILFALSVLLHAYDDKPQSTGAPAQPSSYATSAIGYAGVYDVLRRLGRPVSRSLDNTLAMVGTGGTLVVAEPSFALLSNADGMKLLAAPRLLLVLPKWRGRKDPGKPVWVAAVEPQPLFEAQRTLGLVTVNSDVLRVPWPQSWPVNRLGVTPAGSGTVQLMTGEKMQPVIGDAQGMLVGEIIDRSRRIWVVSDPDILSNHGIGNGDNVALAVALIDGLRGVNGGGGSARIVFDETVHGYKAAEGSPIKLMFRFPFIVVTILLCLAVVMLLLAGTGRFGVPSVPPREIDFGKRALVGNGARLLDYAGYHAAVLQRYLRMSVRIAAQALHAPPDLNEPSLLAWLDRVGEARGVENSCADIMHSVAGLDPANPHHLTRLFEAARDIHHWKGEILNGYSERRHHR